MVIYYKQNALMSMFIIGVKGLYFNEMLPQIFHDFLKGHLCEKY